MRPSAWPFLWKLVLSAWEWKIHFYINKGWALTALFAIMRILKFRSQLMIAFFTVVNLNEPLMKQNFTLTGSKGHGWWFVIGGFRSVLCVCVFQCSFPVIIIMIDGSEKRNCEGGFLNFRVRMFVKSTVTSFWYGGPGELRNVLFGCQVMIFVLLSKRK